MTSNANSLFERLIHRRVLARWTRAAHIAERSELESLRLQRNEARKLRQRLDVLLHVAESRLALPRIGSMTFARPSGTQWAWRPQIWRGPLGERGRAAVPSKTQIGEEVTIFHDCSLCELTYRQIRNTHEEDLAPFGLRLDVLGFEGSFLSLVLDLPPEAVAGISKRHILRLGMQIDMEKPLEVFARLNIKHGPNTEQMVQELPQDGAEIEVDFDLAYSEMNEKQVEKLWIDLIFEGPQMNRVTLRDLTFCRYPRAEL